MKPLLALLLVTLSLTAPVRAADQPNIIVILADENYNPTARCQKK